jgi:hypothetical protein
MEECYMTGHGALYFLTKTCVDEFLTESFDFNWLHVGESISFDFNCSLTGESICVTVFLLLGVSDS